MQTLGIVLAVFGALVAGVAAVGIVKKPSSVYDDKPEEKNPVEGKRVQFVEDNADKENADGVRGHLVAIGTTSHKAGV